MLGISDPPTSSSIKPRLRRAHNEPNHSNHTSLLLPSSSSSSSAMPRIETSATGDGGGGVVIPLISSWLLRTRRGPRYILLLICSPILLPFVCFSFPVICLAELCIRVFRRWRRRKGDYGDDGDGVQRRCGDVEEGGEVRLMQRYLEDQLSLVRSVYECGEGDESDWGFRDFDSFGPGQRPLLHSY